MFPVNLVLYLQFSRLSFFPFELCSIVVEKKKACADWHHCSTKLTLRTTTSELRESGSLHQWPIPAAEVLVSLASPLIHCVHWILQATEQLKAVFMPLELQATLSERYNVYIFSLLSDLWERCLCWSCRQNSKNWLLNHHLACLSVQTPESASSERFPSLTPPVAGGYSCLLASKATRACKQRNFKGEF